MKHLKITWCCISLVLSAGSVFSATEGLFFREDTKDTPPALPVTQDHVANPDLTMTLYGPGADGVKKSHHKEVANDPHYLWSGQCPGRWAVTFRRQNAAVDLSGSGAEVRLRTKNFQRTLRLVLKTPSGWLVSREGAVPTESWEMTCLRIKNLHFTRIDMKTLKAGAPVDRPRLDAVSEIGFTDLEKGEGSRACSRIDWIEVWTETPQAKLYAVNAVDGVQVYEGSRPVCFYHTRANSFKGKWSRADYLHPVMGLDGKPMTRDFPEDHPHHRGVFWAWHQVIVNGKQIPDMWACENFVWDVRKVDVVERTDSYIAIAAKVYWKSPLWKDGTVPFVEERLTFRVNATEKNKRTISFEIALLPLEKEVQIGGAGNVKGYGGFSMRIPLPGDLAMTGSIGPVTPKVTAVEGGDSLQFTGSFNGKKSSVTIRSDARNPGHPPKWILRKAGSCQNPVYPGRTPATLSRDNPLVLRYSIVLEGEDRSRKPEPQ